jgi:hypothetical protein
MMYEKTLYMPETVVGNRSPITLMRSDTKRIGTSLHYIHDLYASIMQVIVVIYLLERQLQWGVLASGMSLLVGYLQYSHSS